MSSVNANAYRALTKTGMRARTVAGGTLARFFVAMTTLAFLSMYTQSGYSYALASVGIGIVQVSNCLIAPQVSRRIDKYGQSKIAPIATCIGMGSLVIVMLIIHFDGPIWAAFLFSALIGFTPQVQSMTRARWSYLFHKNKNIDKGLLKTAFSFEGILDDLAFMMAPALAIALSARLFPEAGLLLGAIAYITGMVIVLSDKETEPDVSFMKKRSENSTSKQTKHKNIFLAYPAILVFFLGMVCLGAVFGFLDPATYGFCREVATEEIASLVFMVPAIFSVLTGLFFGMVYIKASPLKQALGAGIACGVLYMPMAFVSNIPFLFVAHIIGAFCYAPFIITLNSLAERTVDSSRVTESLTWMNAGMQLGLAISPTVAGIIIDSISTNAAFIGVSGCALAIPLIFFISLPILKKGLPQ